jgi:hypothetical protein
MRRTRQDCQFLPHNMKRQTLLAKVKFRFDVPDLERSDVRGRRPALARLDRFSSSVVNDFS